MFETPYGRYALHRYPKTSDPNLQAWESADRYVLQTLADRFPSGPTGRTLICNDAFGAITTALIGHRPIVWNDSALAHHAIRANLETNRLEGPWTLLSSVESPPTGEPIGLVVIKVPKSLRFLEDQLARLAPLIDPSTVVIGAAKAKHIHDSTLKLFERYFGETTTSLAKQKARLIYSVAAGASGSATVVAGGASGARGAAPDLADTCEKATIGSSGSPWPQSFDYEGKPVLGHANVFSHRKLDIGTRFLLEQYDRFDWFDSVEHVVDVGCGNGLLGLVALTKNPSVQCLFVDSSYMAVESSRRNVEAWFGSDALPGDATGVDTAVGGSSLAGGSRARFEVGDALSSVDGGTSLCGDGSVDLVLCNPPFHDSFVMGQDVAARMFSQAAQALRSSGRLVVVANRHLRYMPVLKRYFKVANVAASNPKFVVHVAEQPK